MIDRSTMDAIEDNLKEKSDLIASLVSDVVFLRRQIANRDEIIIRYQSIVTEEEKNAKT